MKYKLLLLLPLLWFAALSVNAAHLVGGEVTYECVGNNNYKVTLIIYRDCNSNGALFDPQASVGVFGSDGILLKTLSITLGPITTIPAVVNNPCLQTPPNVCTEMATYSQIVNLPAISGGYTITYQRCCRNQTINNIPSPGTWGSTFTVDIPSNDTACNSSPHYLQTPPIVLCLNDSLNISSLAFDSDGDSLFYELCNPLHGGSQQFPAPSASPPPYAIVPFANGYSATSPLIGAPGITINPITGILEGKPTQVGQFVFAICVKEFRNGTLLSTVRRDFQFNVTNCVSNVSGNIDPQIIFCDGKTIQFNNTSWNATKYFWDFGDLTSLSDTSVSQFPSYTYSDTGTYKVRFVINKGWPCSDSDYIFVKVHYPVLSNFSWSGGQCIDEQNFSFNAIGSYSKDASYYWYFGNNSNVIDFRDSIPPPITFSQPGKYWVTLQVDDFGCSDVYGDTITVFDRPQADFEIESTQGCVPYTVEFKNNTVSSGDLNFVWDFGDGNTSTQVNPFHTYSVVGSYNVVLMAYTTEGCIDTSYYTLQQPIDIDPTPVSSFVVNPLITTIYDPKVEVISPPRLAGETSYTSMGDGSVYRDQAIISYDYQDTGKYEIKHILINQFNCSDTSVQTVWIQPHSNMFVPNSFTPNGDGVNDVFLPRITGVKEYEFIIFDRWGGVVFRTLETDEGWNGTKNNTGDSLPLGVYSYVIYIKDQNYIYRTKNGLISLLK